MDVKRGVVLGMVGVLSVAGMQVAHAGGERVDAEVLKRARRRPPGTRNIGVYVQTRSEYLRQWERFGYRAEEPPVNFDRRRVVFVATTEQSSCPLTLQAVRLFRSERRLVVRLSDGDQTECTSDLAYRSFVLKLRRAQLTRGDLTIRIRRI